MTKRHNSEHGEFDNYWNSGMHGNQDDYEKYLVIKSSLEGRRYRPPKKGGRVSVVSYYPAMKMALFLLLLVSATQIAIAYRQWGLKASFFPKALYWGLSYLFIRWYFVRRYSGNGTPVLLDRLLSGLPIPRSLVYWGFLIGLLVAVFDLNDLKVWLSLIEDLSRLVRYPVDCSALLAVRLPRIPGSLKAIGSIVASSCGALLIFDIPVSYILNRS